MLHAIALVGISNQAWFNCSLVYFFWKNVLIYDNWNEAPLATPAELQPASSNSSKILISIPKAAAAATTSAAITMDQLSNALVNVKIHAQ